MSLIVVRHADLPAPSLFEGNLERDHATKPTQARSRRTHIGEIDGEEPWEIMTPQNESQRQQKNACDVCSRDSVDTKDDRKQLSQKAAKDMNIMRTERNTFDLSSMLEIYSRRACREHFCDGRCGSRGRALPIRSPPVSPPPISRHEPYDR